MKNTYSILEVIEHLNKIENKDKQFFRVNDESLKIKRGHYGDLIMKLPNGILKPLPIFNYMQDLWKEDI